MISSLPPTVSNFQSHQIPTSDSAKIAVPKTAPAETNPAEILTPKRKKTDLNAMPLNIGEFEAEKHYYPRVLNGISHFIILQRIYTLLFQASFP